jgi:hypothetical protein
MKFVMKIMETIGMDLVKSRRIYLKISNKTFFLLDDEWSQAAAVGTQQSTLISTTTTTTNSENMTNERKESDTGIEV